MKCDIPRYLEYTIFTMISVIKIINDHCDPYKDHASRIKDQTRHFKDHRRPKYSIIRSFKIRKSIVLPWNVTNDKN